MAVRDGLPVQLPIIDAQAEASILFPHTNDGTGVWRLGLCYPASDMSDI